MKIFLDDERTPIDELDWVIVRSYSEFVKTVLEAGEPIFYISFDHDLGDDSLDGYEAAKWFCNLDMQRRGKLIPENFDWYVHSQNPIGAANINQYLEFYLTKKEKMHE